MPSRIGALTLDGSPISQADADRAAADEMLHAREREHAARVIASASLDVSDCRLLLDILGLDASTVAAAAHHAEPASAGSTPQARSTKRRTTAA